MRFAAFAEQHMYVHSLLQLSLLVKENSKDWVFENSYNQIPSDLQSYQSPH